MRHRFGNAVIVRPATFGQEKGAKDAVEPGEVDGKVLVDRFFLRRVVPVMKARRHHPCAEPVEIAAQIGAGGMGEVYRAKDTNLNRDVALKILPEEFAADADRMQRFTREAKADLDALRACITPTKGRELCPIHPRRIANAISNARMTSS